VTRFAISKKAVDYISHTKGLETPNIIIYRGVSVATFSAPGAFLFEPKIKVLGKEPNELFAVIGSVSGIPVWIEKGLLISIGKQDKSIAITLGRGLRTRLKLNVTKSRLMEEQQEPFLIIGDNDGMDIVND
jgi:hypothetical protein